MALTPGPMPSTPPASALEQRRATLVAALGFAQLDVDAGREPAVDALKAYLDSWRGIGNVIDGMLRQGYSINMSASPDTGWAVVLLKDRPGGGAEIVANGYDVSLPRAVQRASWNALIGKSMPGGRSVANSTIAISDREAVALPHQPHATHEPEQ